MKFMSCCEPSMNMKDWDLQNQISQIFKQWASGSWTPATKSACKASPGTRNSRKLETNKTCYPAWKYPEAKWRQTIHPKEKGREPWSIFFLGKMRDVNLQKGKTSQKSTEIINSHFMYHLQIIYDRQASHSLVSSSVSRSTNHILPKATHPPTNSAST